MKKRFLLNIFLFLTLFSCQNEGIDQLTTKILHSIEDKIDAEGGGVEIISFKLTHVNGNEYIGILETIENNQNYSYTVNVISDGKTFIWEIPPVDQSEYNYPAQQNEVQNNSRNEKDDLTLSEEINDDKTNMVEAMEKINDPAFCSLCQGSGIEKNRARGMGLGDDEYGRICPMCNGLGYRTY